MITSLDCRTGAPAGSLETRGTYLQIDDIAGTRT